MTLLLGYMACLFIVNFQPSQRWMGEYVSQLLSDKLGTDVQVDRVEVGLFNRVMLHHVTVLDQSGIKMLEAGLMSAKIEYRAFLEGRVSLRSVSLLDADLVLYKDKPGSPANYQFVLDAFASKDKQKKTQLDLSLNSLIIRRCSIRYDKNYAVRRTDRLDLNHINVQHLEANISLKRLTPDSLNLRVRSLVLYERSGLDIRALSFRFRGNRRKCILTDFNLRLPHSRLHEDQLEATYRMTPSRPLLSTVNVKGHINGATVTLSDLAFVHPRLRDIPLTFVYTTAFQVNPQTIDISGIELREQHNRLALKAHANISQQGGRPIRVSGTIEKMVLKKDLPLEGLGRILPPSALTYWRRLGDTRLKGNCVLEKNRTSHINLEASADIGAIYASLHWLKQSYMMQASSDGIDLGALLGRSDMPEDIAFHADAKADVKGHHLDKLAATCLVDRVSYGGLRYTGIDIDATWKAPHFTLQLDSADPALQINANAKGSFDGKRLSAISLEADSRGVSLAPILKNGHLQALTLTGYVKANFSGIASRGINGQLVVKDFSKREPFKPEADYTLRNLELVLRPSSRGTHAHLASDFATADIDGPLSFTRLRETLLGIAHHTMPSIVGAENLARNKGDEWQFDVRLHRSDFFKQMLNVPLSINSEDGIDIAGYLSGNGKRSAVTLSAPDITYGGFDAKDIRCYLQGAADNYTALIQASKRFGNDDIKMAYTAKAHDNSVLSHLAWSNQDHSDAGEIQAVTGLFRTLNRRVGLSTSILPTNLTISDTIWTLSAGQVEITDGVIDVSRINLSHQDQSVTVSGNLRQHMADSLTISLRSLDVNYILGLVNLKPVSFSGLATGKIVATPGAEKSFDIRAALAIPDFHFNNSLMGDASISAALSTIDKRLYLNADIREAGIGYTNVDGYVGIGEKQLDLNVSGRNTTLEFLRRYLPDVFEGLTGRTTGHCRIFGPFKELDFEGREQANVYAGIAPTGCKYHLADGTVNITPGLFSFENYKVSDDNNGTGELKGTLRHSNLKDLKYDFTVRARSLSMYDKQRSVDLPFYATAYGTGTARLHGYPGHFNADINMRPEHGTRFTYIVDTPDGTPDTSLLQFGKKEDSESSQAVLITKSETNLLNAIEPDSDKVSTDIVLNFLLDMNPEGELKVITDDKAGNYITLAGTGAIRATYYNKGAFQMFGTYTIDHGLYKMALQDVIHKDMELQRGGTINFAGDPYDADLALKAVYTVPAVSLADLGLNLSNNSVRADCILNLGGKVRNPQITFGLNLPNVSEDVRQMVHQLVTTEEDMNRQVLYLLSVGRFYNYNFASTDAAMGGQSQSSVAMKSFLSSTITGQLNNMITNAVGASDWSFGTNLSTGQVGWSDMEVGGLLKGKLMSGRLLVNGNFGYRESTTSTTNFIGDFDIRYLLTPTGNVSLKAYSETNDRYFSKSSMTTQGIGILLQRDFSTLKDLFKRRLRFWVRPAMSDTTRHSR